MPRTKTSSISQDGDLRQIVLTRLADGTVSVEMIVVELDSVNGRRTASRKRVFTRELLLPSTTNGLKAQFDAAENRIKQQFYS